MFRFNIHKRILLIWKIIEKIKVNVDGLLLVFII